jgi:hypothetical protein
MKPFCLNCGDRMWLEDGFGDYLRCLDCNPEPVKQANGGLVYPVKPSKPKVKLKLVANNNRDGDTITTTQ